MTDPSAPRRVRFFQGRVLTADDLNAVQDYARERLCRHNRWLHGWGIHEGLKVTATATGVSVSPGVAIDCAGNELVLENPTVLRRPRRPGVLFCVLGYAELEQSPQPVLVDGVEKLGAEVTNGSVIEQVRLAWSATAPTAHPSGMPPGSPGCGQAHPVALARVSWVAGQTARIAAFRSRVKRPR